MNHTPHILAAVFLCGLWLPIWALISITHQDVWRCAFCGYTNAMKYLVNPTLMEQEFAARQQQQIVNAQRRAERQKMLDEMPQETTADSIRYLWAAYPAGIIIIGIAGAIVGLVVVSSILSKTARTTVTSNIAVNSPPSNIKSDTYTGSTPSVALSTPLPTPKVKSVTPPAPSITKTATVISQNANLRESPDPNGNVIVTVSFGESVEVIKQRGPWFQVRYAGSTGWLHGNTIQLY